MRRVFQHWFYYVHSYMFSEKCSFNKNNEIDKKRNWIKSKNILKEDSTKCDKKNQRNIVMSIKLFRRERKVRRETSQKKQISVFLATHKKFIYCDELNYTTLRHQFSFHNSNWTWGGMFRVKCHVRETTETHMLSSKWFFSLRKKKSLIIQSLYV